MGATGRLFPTIGPEPCLNLQKLVDPLWAPYPVSTQSRLSYAYDALQIEYNLARLAAECLLRHPVPWDSAAPHAGCVHCLTHRPQGFLPLVLHKLTRTLHSPAFSRISTRKDSKQSQPRAQRIHHLGAERIRGSLPSATRLLALRRMRNRSPTPTAQQSVRWSSQRIPLEGLRTAAPGGAIHATIKQNLAGPSRQCRREVNLYISSSENTVKCRRCECEVHRDK
ncbi:hypothetical protein QQS21_000376 [Conoideocrella luteorostrata]|uniref:Uncharacterized protein n=1 Tax=Conoideocrella luteorostrata TaxID=1105319 RepID=A0AAJ0CZ52_9HYPO|nr:hypothetical protein QQS21_000376 [Conoideocrella luteorostrata]